MAAKKTSVAVARKTLAAFKKSIVDTLDRASGDDENIEHLEMVCRALGKVDTSLLNVSELAEDPQLQRAFKKFVSAQVGSFQYLGEEFGFGDDEGATED